MPFCFRGGAACSWSGLSGITFCFRAALQLDITPFCCSLEQLFSFCGALTSSLYSDIIIIAHFGALVKGFSADYFPLLPNFSEGVNGRGSRCCRHAGEEPARSPNEPRETSSEETPRNAMCKGSAKRIPISPLRIREARRNKERTKEKGIEASAKQELVLIQAHREPLPLSVWWWGYRRTVREVSKLGEMGKT